MIYRKQEKIKNIYNELITYPKIVTYKRKGVTEEIYIRLSC